MTLINEFRKILDLENQARQTDPDYIKTDVIENGTGFNPNQGIYTGPIDPSLGLARFINSGINQDTLGDCLKNPEE